MVSDRLRKLFECASYEVMSSGGDGCGIVAFRSTDVQSVAREFEEWRKESKSLSWWLPNRHDVAQDHVLFSDNSNENMTFMSVKALEKQRLAYPVPWHDEIVMEVW